MENISINPSLRSLFPTSLIGKTLFFAFLIAGGLLRFSGLGTQSFWLDEVFSARIVQLPAREILNAIPRDKPPLDYYFQSAAARLGGEAEFINRVPAAVAGSLFLVAFYFLCAHAFGRRVALIALGMAAFNTFMIRYSQESRPYMPYVFFQTLQMFFFLRWWGANRPFHYPAVVPLLATSVLSVYTLYAGLVVLGCELIVVAIAAMNQRTRISILNFAAFGALLGITVMMCIPLRSRATLYFPEHNPWSFEKFSLDQFTEIFHACLVGAVPIARAWSVPLGMAGFAAGIHGGFRAGKTRETGLMASVGIIAILFPLFYAHIHRAFFIRYVIFAAPAMIALLAVGADFATRTFSQTRAGANALIILAGLIFVPVSVDAFLHPKDVKVDWRGLSGYLARIAQNGDVIAVSGDQESIPLRYYLQRLGRPDLKVEERNGFEGMEKETASWIVSMDYSAVSAKNEFPHLRMEVIRHNPPRANYQAFMGFLKGGTRLDFTTAPADLIGIGWSFPERWDEGSVRWSVAKDSVLFFPARSAEAGTLRIHALPYTFKDGPPQSVFVTVNDQSFEARELKDGGFDTLSWELPAGVMKEGYNRVVIHFARVRDMSDFSPSHADSRTFAAAIDWVEWDPATAE